MNADWLRSSVAELLDVPAASLNEDVPLTDQGLDSVRLMSLVERWRAMGVRIGFAELAETPTLRAWRELVVSRQRNHD